MSFETVKTKFTNPKWFGVMQNPDGTGEAGNVICGDTISISVKLNENATKVSQASFVAQGCIYSIACAEQLSDILNGANVKEAEEITDDTILTALDGIPSSKRHCAVMAVNAWRTALNEAYEKRAIGTRLTALNGGQLKSISENEEIKKILTIPDRVKVEHRLAEMFDDYFIPFAKENGRTLSLKHIDVNSEKVYVKIQANSSNVLKHLKQMLDKYFKQKFTIIVEQ